MVEREHNGGAAVAMVARLGNGEVKSERGRAREWEWEREAATPPFTPPASQTGQADTDERPPHGTWPTDSATLHLYNS